MTTNMSGNFITISELSKLTGLDTEKVFGWAKKGVFPDAVLTTINNNVEFLLPRKYIILLLNNKVNVPDIILESDIEAAIVKEAKKLGHEIVKIQGVGAKAWPDQLVVLNNGKCFFAEIKIRKEDTTVHQKRKHETIKALNHKVYVLTSVEEFRTIEKMFVNEDRV